MNYFLGNAYFFVVLLTILSENNYSQASSQHLHSITAFNKYPGNRKTTGQVQRTQKLPTPVKKAFYESQCRDWFVEKITVFDSSGETFYKFILNNGNLLDGDHYDSFFQKRSLNISNSGFIVQSYIFDFKYPDQYKVSIRDLFPTDPCFYRGS